LNAILLLLGLLVLSYLGSALVSSHAIRGLGLPSGAEYLCLGFVLGSHVLGIISQPLLADFEPLLLVGASWIAFVAGMTLTEVGKRRIALGRACVGVLSTLLLGLGVGAAVWFALPVLLPRLLGERPFIAGGAAIVCSGSTRQAVRWVVQRHAAQGPLSDALADYARVSSLVPVLGLSLLMAHYPEPSLAAAGFAARVGVTWGIGALLGLVAVLLVGRQLTRDEIWGVLVGTSLLSMGVAARLGLSSVSAAFALGLTIGVLSPRRSELSAMVRSTERAVLLPLAVLAGALINLREAPALGVIVALALAARYLGELMRGGALMLASRAARTAGPLLGLCLVSSGEVTLACAVSLALSFHSPAALTLLVVAGTGLLTGEIVGPFALRRSLARAGELAAPTTPVEPEQASSGGGAAPAAAVAEAPAAGRST
jgi:hypothetical protein